MYGFLGEIREWNDGTTIVQKTHDAGQGHVQQVWRLQKLNIDVFEECSLELLYFDRQSLVDLQKKGAIETFNYCTFLKTCSVNLLLSNFEQLYYIRKNLNYSSLL